MVKPRIIKSGGSGWKPIALDPSVFKANDLEGLIGIEELTDYSIGRVKPAKKAKIKSKNDKVKAEDESFSMAEKKPKKKRKSKKNKKGPLTDETLDPCSDKVDLVKDYHSDQECPKAHSDKESDDLSSCMASWNGLGVPSVLLRALKEKSFFAPTKIQALSLPPAIFGRRDILGAAETGSGKTLAFGLPILNGILNEISSERDKEEQDITTDQDANSSDEEDEDTMDEKNESDVEEDFSDVDNDKSDIEENEEEESISEDDAMSNDSDGENHSDHSDDPEDTEELKGFDGKAQCVRVIDNADFDFLAPEAHKKKSKYNPRPLYALILTPTRELAVQISQHLRTAAKYTNISVAVVVGGLASQKQERLLNRGPEIVVGTPGRLWELIEEGHPHLAQVGSVKYLAIDETDRMLEKGHFEELQRILEKINEDEALKQKRQNFVFSATLTLTHEPPRYVMKKKGKKKGKGHPEPARLTPAQKLASIMKTVGLTDPKVVDITETSGVAQMLTEAQIICSIDEKDYYLYYFLQRHPGRTLVFCNSIEAVRRLTQLFTILECSPWALHAKMHQKHRLKNLERFCSNPRGVLLATDVAARGLDIPNVQHVIHYQTPRTAEGYIHRSGRTARAQQEGLTVLLIEPSEVNTFSRLFRTLGRDSDLPTFPVESDWMSTVKQRVDLARRLDKMELQARRINTEHGWFDKLVKEMDLEISDDELPTSYSREGGNKVKKQANVLRKQLAALLAKPMIPKGFSSKYPTQTGKLVVPLFPGALASEKEKHEENAVSVLKQSLEKEKALKRKINNERSKRNKRNKRRKNKKASVEEESSQSSNDGSDKEDSDS